MMKVPLPLTVVTHHSLPASCSIYGLSLPSGRQWLSYAAAAARMSAAHAVQPSHTPE